MLHLMSFSPSNFGRYASQTERSMDELNDNNQAMQTQQNSNTNHIPPLMSLPITPPIVTKSIHEKSTISTSVVKENIEPLTAPQHGLGPIQRPNKLSCPPTTQLPSFLSDSTQSPNTPDVLVQINYLLDHQNSVTTIPTTPNVSNPAHSSSIINDISTPNVPWTPFSPPEWSSKYDSTWPITNMQSPNVSLARQLQNPFAQQQMASEELSVWSSGLGTATPCPITSKASTQRTSEWNQLFSSTIPSSNKTGKSMNSSWLKFLPASDPPLVDSETSNKQESEANNPFWNLISSNETQQNTTTSWWPETSSDGNNNDNDKSRWDFAQ